MSNIEEICAEIRRLDASATPVPWQLDMGNWDVESRSKLTFRFPICAVDPISRNVDLSFEPSFEEKAEASIHEQRGYSDAELITYLRNNAMTLVEAYEGAMKGWAVECNERDATIEHLRSNLETLGNLNKNELEISLKKTYEIEQLYKENSVLKHRADLNAKEKWWAIEDRNKYEAEVKRLREGLEFYANGWHYKKTESGDVEIDTGEHARKYLSTEDLAIEISRAKENDYLRNVIAKVQDLIGPLTANSSEVLAPIREAWNINARALANKI